MDKKRSTLVSAAVAGIVGATLALSSPSLGSTKVKTPKGKGAKVPCYGINKCGGKGDYCGVPGSHKCGNKNSCKGKGLVKVSKEECLSKGGQIANDAWKKKMKALKKKKG